MVSADGSLEADNQMTHSEVDSQPIFGFYMFLHIRPFYEVHEGLGRQVFLTTFENLAKL